MNKELYSYIVSSLDIMNKSLIMNEQNCVKLFSYLYNNYYDLNNKVSKLEKAISDINNDIIKLNDNVTKKNNLISKDLAQLKKTQRYYADKISVIENEKTNFQIFVENIKTNISNFFIKIYNIIKDIFNKYYKIIYNKIFYKKIKKMEEEKRKQEEAERKRKEKEYKAMIKNILKK